MLGIDLDSSDFYHGCELCLSPLNWQWANLAST